MAAVRAIGAGLEQTAREAARADVKIAVRNIVVMGGVVADEMSCSCNRHLHDVNLNQSPARKSQMNARDQHSNLGIQLQ